MIDGIIKILFWLFDRPQRFQNIIFFHRWFNIIRIQILLIPNFELVFNYFKMSKSLQWTNRLMSKFLSSWRKNSWSSSFFSFMTICHKFIYDWLIIFSILIQKLRKLLSLNSLIVLLRVQSTTFNLIFIRRKITIVASILIFFGIIFLIKFYTFWIWIFEPAISNIRIQTSDSSCISNIVLSCISYILIKNTSDTDVLRIIRISFKLRRKINISNSLLFERIIIIIDTDYWVLR